MNAMNQPIGIHPKPPRAARGQERRKGQWDIPVATGLVALALFYIWTRRNDHVLTAETGMGYWLGIAGSTMMLLLLLYPLRKRFRFMNRFGAVPGWFRLHMLFGVVGPGLVLMHSNFNLGSLNSRMALFSMLIVAGSGYIGRFLYYRIQGGLSARKQMVVAIRNGATERWENAGLRQEQIEGSLSLLQEFEKSHLGGGTSFFAAFGKSAFAKTSRRRLKQNLICQSDYGNSPEFGAAIEEYLLGARKVQTFILYERLFSLWHLLHLPLFLILFAAAILHIVAVHLF